MSSKSLFAVFAALMFSYSLAIRAGETPDPKVITEALKTTFPDLQVKAVRSTPIPGLFEVEVGADVFYATKDGRYVVLGNLIDTASRSSLTDARRRELVAARLAKLDPKQMIVIGPDKPKRTLTVFTDVDCPWCARLHKDVPELNKAGVRVQYLFYPRAGLNSETYKRAVAVWCAKERAKAIGIAKSGGKLDMKDCPNPVKEDFALGRELGVEGTPTMFLDDGTRIGGYLAPPRLLGAMGLAPPVPPTAAK